MSKIGFNPDAISSSDKPSGDVRHAVGLCAFEPFVVDKPGIEAIKEGLRLANIKGFEPPVWRGSTKDVDP